MIEARTSYSVICKDEFLRRFVINVLLSVNEKAGVGVYPSLLPNNVVVSDSKEPNSRLCVISTEVRSGFRVLDLEDYKERLKVLAHIFGLDFKEMGKKVKSWHKDKIFRVCVSYASLDSFDRGSFEFERLLEREGSQTLASKVEEVVSFVMGFEEDKFKRIFKYLEEFGSFIYILSSLLNGKIKHTAVKDEMFMQRLLNLVFGILRTENNEEAILSIYGRCV